MENTFPQSWRTESRDHIDPYVTKDEKLSFSTGVENFLARRETFLLRECTVHIGVVFSFIFLVK